MERAARCRLRASPAARRCARADPVAGRSCRPEGGSAARFAPARPRRRACGPAHRRQPSPARPGRRSTRRLPASPAREARDDGGCVGVRGELAGGFDRIEPVDDLVETHEAIADVERRERPRLGACGRERTLRGMERLLHRGELDDAGAALQRMERTKRVVETLGIVRLLLERQQVVAGLIDELPRFDEELLQELIHAEPRRAAMRTAPAFPG